MAFPPPPPRDNISLFITREYNLLLTCSEMHHHPACITNLCNQSQTITPFTTIIRSIVWDIKNEENGNSLSRHNWLFWMWHINTADSLNMFLDSCPYLLPPACPVIKCTRTRRGLHSERHLRTNVLRQDTVHHLIQSGPFCPYFYAWALLVPNNLHEGGCLDKRIT